jgi:hypothetical protein
MLRHSFDWSRCNNGACGGGGGGGAGGTTLHSFMGVYKATDDPAGVVQSIRRQPALLRRCVSTTMCWAQLHAVR